MLKIKKRNGVRIILGGVNKSDPIFPINLNLEKREPIIKKQYLNIYFEEIEKIPNFYNWDEWKETEAILFNRILHQLKGYFNVRGMLSSSNWNEIEVEFNKEREKYVKVKEKKFKENIK